MRHAGRQRRNLRQKHADNGEIAPAPGNVQKQFSRRGKPVAGIFGRPAVREEKGRRFAKRGKSIGILAWHRRKRPAQLAAGQRLEGASKKARGLAAAFEEEILPEAAPAMQEICPVRAGAPLLRIRDEVPYYVDFVLQNRFPCVLHRLLPGLSRSHGSGRAPGGIVFRSVQRLVGPYPEPVFLLGGKLGNRPGQRICGANRHSSGLLERRVVRILDLVARCVGVFLPGYRYGRLGLSARLLRDLCRHGLELVAGGAGLRNGVALVGQDVLQNLAVLAVVAEPYVEIRRRLPRGERVVLHGHRRRYRLCADKPYRVVGGPCHRVVGDGSALASVEDYALGRRRGDGVARNRAAVAGVDPDSVRLAAGNGARPY